MRVKVAKLLRRIGALVLAVLSIWWLLTGGGVGAAAEQLFPPSPSPRLERLEGELGVWERLVLSQSPYLAQPRVLTALPPVQSQVPEPSLLPQVPSPVPVDREGQEEEPTLSPAASQSQNVIARTLLPATDGSYPSAGGVFLFNRTEKAVDMEALAQASVTLTGQGKGPQILIVHTHATEAYTQDGQDVYTESDPYRTTDDGHNVVRVGDEMAAAFAQAGLNVLHDRTLHDYPNYNGAYTRSKATVEEYLAAYPSISIVLDVHRDALIGEDGSVYKVVADQETTPGCAQVMLVVGTDAGGSDHPNWSRNLTLAMALERKLNDNAPTLARPITLRRSAFNQQLSPGSLLVEVGGHGNTLQEAITAARSFAQLSAPVIKELLAQGETPAS